MDQTPHIFQGYGVELEYIIVREDSLDILPVADQLLRAVSGSDESEVEMGSIGWSNELVLHVVELKTNGPVATLNGLAPLFQEHVVHANRLLSGMGGRLMPTAMHPWMDPDRETRLWPHDSHEIYDAYNSIFGCHGHGWSNVQSTHINLAFNGDEEFGRLHTAVRLILPLIPALAASSPFVDGRQGKALDSRLEFYKTNQLQVPVIAGAIIPEPVVSRREYEEKIFARIYRDIAPFDPKGILQHEWLNSRGAIARFDRSAIEIRLVDIQECPKADLAVTAAIIGVIKALVSEQWSPMTAQLSLTVEELAIILDLAIQHGEQAKIDNRRFLEMFGINRDSAHAGEIWEHLVKASLLGLHDDQPEISSALNLILQQGTLAQRLIMASNGNTSHRKLHELYLQLCHCLAQGELFEV